MKLSRYGADFQYSKTCGCLTSRPIFSSVRKSCTSPRGELQSRGRYFEQHRLSVRGCLQALGPRHDPAEPLLDLSLDAFECLRPGLDPIHGLPVVVPVVGEARRSA